MAGKKDIQTMLPVMSNDPTDRIMQMIGRYDPNFVFQGITAITDFPVASDYELLVHYLRGGAGPFIDLLLYVDYGVGWYLKPEGFSNSEKGEQAKDLVMNDYMERMEYDATLNKFGAWLEVLGRSCLIETYDLNGDYFIDPQFKVKGVNSINPMTLDIISVRRALADTTGLEKYKQNATLVDGKSTTVEFEQERVRYYTKSPLTDYSPLGNSDMQRCITDLRTLARFPHYRGKLGRKYSELFRVVEIDAEAVAKTEMGMKITEDFTEAQKLLDDTASFYREQEERGGTVATYNWEQIKDSSWAGKEVKLDNIEQKTLESIALKFGIPLALLHNASSSTINRATLEALLDTFVSKREKGPRNFVYTPEIERTSRNILSINGITEGRLKCKYNPFLSKDLLKIADIISRIWQTGSISKPEIREMIDLPNEVNLGGEDWEEYDPFPSKPVETTQTSLEDYITPPTGENKQLFQTKEWQKVKKMLLKEGVIREVE